ncbi:ABC transporter permease [Luteococcus sp. Sow4_B9]|uniref:ABC transporter permease n=1 Tax=Luteococcus sp. Sow4_B9 TaxID=3438792 RepID=UPI003F964F76
MMDDRTRRRSLATRLLVRPEIGSLVGGLAIMIFFLAVAPSFRNLDNVGTILYQASTIGMMAVPVAMLMIGGEFDLSAGVLVTTAGLAAALLSWWFNLNVWVGVLLALLVTLAIGLVNGLLLVRTKLPSFLTTLSTFFVLQGVNLGVTRWVSGNVSSAAIDDMEGWDSARKLFASQFALQLGEHTVTLRMTLLFWLLLTIVGAWVMLRTRQGNWVLAVGGDEAAARASGVPVRRTKVALYLFVAFCAWLSGMHLLFGYGVVQSGEGVGKEFIYIIAAVIGGCLMSGGFGSVVGASVGALIYGMTQLGINYAGWNPDWFKTFLGVMLLASTLLNVYLKRKAEQR